VQDLLANALVSELLSWHLLSEKLLARELLTHHGLLNELLLLNEVLLSQELLLAWNGLIDDLFLSQVSGMPVADQGNLDVMDCILDLRAKALLLSSLINKFSTSTS